VAESLGDGRSHAPARILEGSREGLQGTGIANPTESLSSGPAHTRALVLEDGHEWFYRAGVADLPQSFRSSLAYARGVISKSGYEACNVAGIADLAQGLGGVPAHTPATRILQRLAQRWGVSVGLELVDVGRSEQRQMPILRG
jgi:hypothetical protein